MATPSAKAVDIAMTAASLVGGKREGQHGDKHLNFRNIAVLWTAYLAIRRGPSTLTLDSVDVGHMMALLKIARTQAGDLCLDDYIDSAGYIACAGEIAMRQK